MKRKRVHDAAKTNNMTPTESMATDYEIAEEFTDRDAQRAQERARQADKRAFAKGKTK